MRVALVSPFDPFPGGARPDGAFVGGVERVFAEMSRQLALRGHDVRVHCSSDDPEDLARDADVTREAFPGQALPRSGSLRVERVPRSGMLLRAPIARIAEGIEDDVDLVHVAATYPFTTPAVLKRARQLDRPCVLDFHFEPDPVSALGRAAARVYRRIGPPTYGLADLVLLRSHAYGRSAGSLGRIPEDRWRIVPNGIDPERFTPEGPRFVPGDARGDGYLLFVGRLVPYKGLEVLLRALARLDRPPRLVIAGDGPLRGHLEGLARRLDVDAAFLGRVEDEDLPSLYRGARATLLPSVGQQECFGITLIESMACGTPVIASDLPGVGDVAREGGAVAPSEDVAGLAACIERSLRPGALPHGPLLARRIHDRYAWSAVARRLEGVYQELLTKEAGCVSSS